MDKDNEINEDNIISKDNNISKDNRKGLTNMTALQKPRQATTIAQGMTNTFFEELNKNRATKEYWKECEETKKKLTPTIIEQMKKICNGEK